jgi:hypothetical protein
VLAGKDSLRRADARPCPLRSVPADFDVRRAAPAGTSLLLWLLSVVDKKNVDSAGLLMEVADDPPSGDGEAVLPRLLFCQNDRRKLIRIASRRSEIAGISMDCLVPQYRWPMAREARAQLFPVAWAWRLADCERVGLRGVKR